MTWTVDSMIVVTVFVPVVFSYVVLTVYVYRGLCLPF